MAELADFVRRGASKITPQILRGVYKRLPLMKIEFSQIQAPNYPHLVDQLQFLANVVEDFADNKADDIPYITIAYAAFAITYVQRQDDLIPDSIPDFGMADDSGVVRVVLIEHERVLAQYAEKLGTNWSKITVQA